MLWQCVMLKYFHSFMCAIVANIVYLPIDWLIDHCRLLTTPKLVENFCFLYLSIFFFFLFSFFWVFRCVIFTKLFMSLIRIWIRNQLFLPPHLCVFVFFFSLHSWRLLFSLTVPCCLFKHHEYTVQYYLYNGISPDSRWNERLNESKLSV